MSLPPAPPPIASRRLPEELRRRDAPRHRLRRRGGDRAAPSRPSPSEDDGGGTALETVADLLGELAEPARVLPRHLRDHEREPVDLDDTIHERTDDGVPVSLPELPELAPQPLVLLDHLPRVLHRRARVRATERVHEIVEERSLGVDLAEGVGTDQGLDPPHARADRAFVQEPISPMCPVLATWVPPQSSRE